MLILVHKFFIITSLIKLIKINENTSIMSHRSYSHFRIPY